MAHGGVLAPSAGPSARTVRRVASGRAWAAGATLVVLGFIAITWWWTSRDRGVPFADAGSHLFTAVSYRELIAHGDVSELLHRSGYYPPTTFLVGALAMFAGGLNPAAPVLGQNVVYVSLLGLGVYQAGRLVAGAQAGFLAVVFALGSPLLIEQFHVFMIDAPQAGLVAVTIWLVLASDHFARLSNSIAAGVVCGVGIASKEQFPLFVAGLIAFVLMNRRSWRNWRGIAGFAVALSAVGAPWYVANLSELGHYASAGLANANLPARGRPPLLSLSNLGWYVWAFLNGVLFAPLFAFAAIGVCRAGAFTLRCLREPRRSLQEDPRPPLLSGLFTGWLAISLTPHHDMRYALPLVPYLAVLGTAWVPALSRFRRRVAVAALALAATATTLGASFGVGPDVRLVLGSRPVATDVSFGIPPPDQITVYAEHDFVVSAPRRGDDVLGLLDAMRRDGVTSIAWHFSESPLGDPYFDPQGLAVFARFAGLTMFDLLHDTFVQANPSRRFTRRGSEHWFLAVWNVDDPDHVFLIHRSAYFGEPPCMRLRDGSGLWLRRGYGDDPSAPPYCPPGIGEGG